MIVDLDILNIGELFEVLHERTRDSVQRAVGLACPCEINVCNAISVFELAIPGETIEHQGKSLIVFNADRTLEIFIEHRANNIP